MCSVFSDGNKTDRKYFSYTELMPFLKQIDEQGAALREAPIGPTFRLPKRRSEPAQWVSPLPAVEEQSAAGRRARFRDGIGFLTPSASGGGQGGAPTREWETFRQDETP